MTIQQDVASVEAQYSKAKELAEDLRVLLQTFSKVQPEVMLFLISQGIPFTKAQQIIETSLSQYGALFTQSLDKLAQVERHHRAIKNNK